MFFHQADDVVVLCMIELGAQGLKAYIFIYCLLHCFPITFHVVCSPSCVLSDGAVEIERMQDITSTNECVWKSIISHTLIVRYIFLTLASNQMVVHNYMYCYFEMFNNIPKHRSSSMNSLLLPSSSVFQHLSPRCVVSPSRGAVGGDAHVRTLRRLDLWSQSDCKARGCSMRI